MLTLAFLKKIVISKDTVLRSLFVGLLCCFFSASIFGAVVAPDSYLNYASTDNQMNVADVLDASVGNPGMQPIYSIMNDPRMTGWGVNDTLDQMTGSLRANGIRLTMSTPWLPIMNRARTIGQYENHIIASNKRDWKFSDNGVLVLAQAADKKDGLLKGTIASIIPNDKSEEDEDEGEEFEVGSDFGGHSINIDCLGKNSKNVWFSPVHSATNIGNDGNAPSCHIDRTGFMAGFEKGHCPCSNYGVVFGYTVPILMQYDGNITSDDLMIGLYGRKKLKAEFYVNGWLGYGHQMYREKRYVRIPDLGSSYKYEGKFEGDSYSSCIEVYRAIYCKPGFVLRPLAAFDFQYGKQKGFREKGRGPFGLVYDDIEYQQIMLRCGIATQIGASDGSSKMTIRQRIYYARLVGNEPYPDSISYFEAGGQSTTFHTRGTDADRDYMILGMGGQCYLDAARTCQLYGDYDAIVSHRLTTHAVSLGLIQRF